MNLLPCPACREDQAVEDSARDCIFIVCDDHACAVRGPAVYVMGEATETDWEKAGRLWNDMPRAEINKVLHDDLDQMAGLLGICGFDKGATVKVPQPALRRMVAKLRTLTVAK